MVTCLLLYYSILFNITTIQSLAVGNSVPFYLAATVLLLTISALPYQFLAGFYLVTAITVGESFDASSIHSTDLPLLFPALYLFLGMLLSYSCLKMVKFHHPGFFFSMVFKSKRFVTSILVTDVTGKSHSFSFAPYATVFDLRSQMNSKFNITSDLYWLSNRGKPLHDFVSLKEISGAVIMNGHLTGGAKCCLKGCENDAGARKFDSLIGRGGHKPAKGKSSSKSRSDAQRGILKVTPCIVQCSQCRNEICPSSDVPCNKQHKCTEQLVCSTMQLSR